jgi:hypothetical protein
VELNQYTSYVYQYTAEDNIGKSGAPFSVCNFKKVLKCVDVYTAYKISDANPVSNREFTGLMVFNQIEKAKTKGNYYYVGLVEKSRKRKSDDSEENEEDEEDELDYK